ncbi:MAG: major capsid protein [Thermodesulfobacteriota bacterium]
MKIIEMQDTGGFNLAGPVANRLLAANMDPGALRPWIDPATNQAFITINGKNHPVANATLRHDEWKLLDTVLLETTKSRLNGVADLLGRGLKFDIPNGLGTMILEYEDVSDIAGAQFDMDGVSRSREDTPEYDLKGLPLPIVHKGFSYSARVLAASRRSGTPLDTTNGVMSARKVAEALEDLLFNGTGGITYGGYTIYGYNNHPNRITANVTNWDDPAKDGEAIVHDILNAITQLNSAGFYGPFVLYVCTHWYVKLLDDYKAASDKSIISRLKEITEIQDIKVADKLTDNTASLVQMTADVVRMVVGMMPTTVQWETEGGMRQHFKHMAIMVPQIRADQNGHCGVAHLY